MQPKNMGQTSVHQKHQTSNFREMKLRGTTQEQENDFSVCFPLSNQEFD